VNAVRLGKLEPRVKWGPADPSEDPAACAESKAHATLSHEHTGPRDDRGAVAPESALRHRGGHPWTFWFTPFTFLLPFFSFSLLRLRRHRAQVFESREYVPGFLYALGSWAVAVPAT